MPGSGGAQAHFLRTRKRPPEEKRNQTPNMTRDEDSHGEGYRWGHRDAEGTTVYNPLGTDRYLGIGRGRQGGENRRGKCQRNKACGAGCRYEQQRLAGGKWGKIPGGK